MGSSACAVCGCVQEKLLSPKEVATVLRFTPRHIRNLIQRGDIDGVRIGRQWRVVHASLDRYIESCTVEAA